MWNLSLFCGISWNLCFLNVFRYLLNIHEERCYHTVKKDIMRVLPDSNLGLRESSVTPVKPDKMVKGDQIITAERQKAGRGQGGWQYTVLNVSGHLG